MMDEPRRQPQQSPRTTKHGGGRSRRNASGGASPAKRRGAAQDDALTRLSHLGPREGRDALLALAARRPDLVSEITAIVREQAELTSFRDVADRVVAALSELTMFDVRTHSAEDPFGRYHPFHEAAADLVAETLQPFVDTIGQYARMGMLDAALRHANGVLSGLYRAEREHAVNDGELSVGELSDFAQPVLDALAPIRRRRLDDTPITVAQKVQAFAVLHLHDWTWLQKPV